MDCIENLRAHHPVFTPTDESISYGNIEVPGVWVSVEEKVFFGIFRRAVTELHTADIGSIVRAHNIAQKNFDSCKPEEKAYWESRIIETNRQLPQNLQDKHHK